MNRVLFSLFVIIGLSVSSFAYAKGLEIQTKEVEYSSGQTKLKGFFAWPKLKDPNKKVPGVLVIHEWWGENEYARSRAKQLAELGYAAFALDMYGNAKTTEDPKVAGQWAGETFKSGQVKPRFDAALEVLKKESIVDADRIAAIGYCFGGNIVLSMARAGVPLKAVVSFHGAIPEKQTIAKDSVTAEVLILNGAADKMVPQTAVDEFEKDMRAANAKIKVINYKGAEHAFTNPGATQLGTMHGIAIAYDKEADEKSWKEMKNLFHKVF